MRSILVGAQVTIAIVELIAWLPLSWLGLTLNAAYVVAGNSPPPNLVWGLFFVALTFLGGPIYALTQNGRAHRKVAFAALSMPLLALAITYFNNLPSLTHAPL